jgi:hypothetical protein
MERINKRVARLVYERGGRLWVVPHKVNPTHPIFGAGLGICKDDLPETGFDAFINGFTYYNCTNELGRYPAFYVK